MYVYILFLRLHNFKILTYNNILSLVKYFKRYQYYLKRYTNITVCECFLMTKFLKKNLGFIPKEYIGHHWKIDFFVEQKYKLITSISDYSVSNKERNITIDCEKPSFYCEKRIKLK